MQTVKNYNILQFQSIYKRNTVVHALKDTNQHAYSKQCTKRKLVEENKASLGLNIHEKEKAKLADAVRENAG